MSQPVTLSVHSFRFQVFRNRGGFWFGFALDWMPFAYTIGIGIGWHIIQIGIGKAYDEYDMGNF